MPVRRVLMVDGDCLLSAGLHSILAPRTNLEVRTIVFIDIPHLTAYLHSFAPDVVILDELSLSAHVSGLLEAFLSFPKLRVISLNIDNNRLQVYEKKQVLVTTPEDFFAEVR